MIYPSNGIYLKEFKNSRIIRGCMSGLKPAVVGMIANAVLGVLLRPRVFRMIAEMASRGGNSFLWYSETAVGLVKQTAYDPQVPIWPNLLVVPVIVVVALLLCLWFLRMARQGGTRKQGKSRVRVPGLADDKGPDLKSQP